MQRKENFSVFLNFSRMSMYHADCQNSKNTVFYGSQVLLNDNIYSVSLLISISIDKRWETLQSIKKNFLEMRKSAAPS
jgi:hypothetical protein